LASDEDVDRYVVRPGAWAQFRTTLYGGATHTSADQVNQGSGWIVELVDA
jgi:hypothetical protein